jgi:DNA-binding MarR family transcriptional regulator
MRARLLAKVVTAIYDDKLRSFGISSAQFALLTAICLKPSTRADIARLRHLNRSTLTRDLKAMFSAGWIQEVREGANGRTKPISLTRVGKELMLDAQPTWLAAQAQAEALLGRDGIDALMSVTDGLKRNGQEPRPGIALGTRASGLFPNNPQAARYDDTCGEESALLH